MTQPIAPLPRPVSPLALLGGAVVAVGLVGSVVAYPLLPAHVPAHLDAHGNVDGSMPRWLGAFFLPVTAAVVLGVVRLATKKQRETPSVAQALDALLLLTTTLLIGLHALLLALAFVPGLDVARAIGLSLSGFWACVSLLLPRITRNPVAGIRTPWTLASDEVWARTHRFGGQIGFVAALGGLVAAALGQLPLTIALVVASSVAPLPYSYWISRRANG